MIVHSCVETTLAFFDECVCGHRDDRQGLKAWIGSKKFRSSEAIHLGHLQVHEDYVEGRGLLALRQDLDCFAAVIGDRDDGSCALEKFSVATC